MIIDAKDLILGRLATFVAKQSLLGEKIDVINCEKAAISGRKDQILKKYKNLLEKGTPVKGPFIHRSPDRFVRRAIRGMLPYKQPKGSAALKNIKCFIGIPKEMENKKPETLKNANISKIPNLNYIMVKDLCKQLGAKS